MTFYSIIYFITTQDTVKYNKRTNYTKKPVKIIPKTCSTGVNRELYTRIKIFKVEFIITAH